MAPADGLPTVHVGEPASRVLDLLGRADAVAVVDDTGTVLGIVTPEALEAALVRADRLHAGRAR
jgi:predicted transcriptional regulator